MSRACGAPASTIANGQAFCEHASLDAFEAAHSPPTDVRLLDQRGEGIYCDVSYREGRCDCCSDPETSGLPDDGARTRYPSATTGSGSRCARLSRSLNLSNAVAVACYEAWRQLSFRGQHLPGT